MTQVKTDLRNSVEDDGDIHLIPSEVGLGNVTNDTQTKAAVMPNTFPGAGQVPIGNAGNSAYVPQSISGDGTLSALGALVITKTNGVAFGTMATQNASNVTISGGTITGLPLPTAASDAATKAYVDALSAGLSMHTAVRLASTTNHAGTYNNGAAGVGATLTNSGALAALTVNGTAVAAGDRVLLKNQTTPAQNGIYTVTNIGSGAVAWVLTRATDFDSVAANKVTEGASVLIEEGTTLAATLWIETGQGPFTIGTTAITFTELQIVPSPAGVTTYNSRIGAVTAIGTDVPLRSYLAGLTLSTAGSSATFGIAAGVATDSTNAAMMALASAYTKTTGAWALGTAAGSLDTGAIANSTWYHVYIIQRVDTGVVDVLISLSATAPTLPANYTLFRRIGSMKTDGSAQWTLFFQDGDKFRWSTPVSDVAASNPGTTAVTRTLSVPTGVRVQADVATGMSAASSSGGANAIYLSDLSCADIVPAGGGAVTVQLTTVNTGTIAIFVPASVMTNTSAQIRSRCQSSDANTTFSIGTIGWTDQRGRVN